MHCIHNKKVNNISEFHLLHNMINPSKRTKNIKIHYYPILHGFMNTRRGGAKYNIFKSDWKVELVPRLQ